MTQEEKKKNLVSQLARYYEGDMKKVKALGDGCKAIGFPITEHMDAIADNPDAFMTLITYSDFGFLNKLEEVLKILKGQK